MGSAIKKVVIRGQSYPVVVSGKGYNCLVIGNGVQVERTLTENFKQHFRVFATDLYTEADYDLTDPATLSMQQFVEDIKTLADQLNLKKFVLLGHSAYGMVALEFAKTYPGCASGIVMIGTPLNWNDEVVAQNTAIFEQHADGHRKQVDARRQAEMAATDMNHLPPAAQFAYTMSVGENARYWHDPEFDSSIVWDNVALSSTVDHLFTTVFPSYDVTSGMDKVAEPVLLAGGISDYDCCPLYSWPNRNDLPAHTNIQRFEKSGHWPQLERLKTEYERSPEKATADHDEWHAFLAGAQERLADDPTSTASAAFVKDGMALFMRIYKDAPKLHGALVRAKKNGTIPEELFPAPILAWVSQVKQAAGLE